MSDEIKTSVVNSSEIGKDGVVLSEKEMEEMNVPLKKEELPSSKSILSKVHKIMEFMCTDDMLKVRSKNMTDYKNIIKEKFSEFEETYPSVFNMVIEGNDITMLIHMLKQIDMVKNNKITMKEAETTLRDDLAEKYVYPNLSKKQMKKIKKYMNKK